MDTHALITIVVPVYGEGRNLPRLVERFDTVADDAYRWEYLFVNDGSPDDSLEVLRSLQRQHARIRIIDLSRNFGKEAALSAGLAHARGDAVICIDADLQHPPELIPELVEQWRKGAEVVVTVREQTEEPSIVRRVGSAVFYWLLTRLSDVEVVSKSTDFRLIDRRVVNEFVKLGDHDRLVRGLVDWLGFRRARVTFRAAPRLHGSSSFSYSRLTSLFFNGIMAHSSAPLKWVGLLGVLTTLAFSALLAFVLIAEAINPNFFPVSPIAKMTLVITILISVVLTALGVISVYIARIYAEVVRKPIFVVREEYPETTERQVPAAAAAREQHR